LVIDNSSAEAPGTRSGALRLELDERENGQSVTRVVAAPSLDDVVEALESLDQERHTELTVVDGSGAYITVGGGRGRYHVYMSAYDHDDRIVAQDPAAADRGETQLIVDGRATRYRARDVVDFEAATLAIREFLRSGRPHSGLTWGTP
jgi:hypothetical protein